MTNCKVIIDIYTKDTPYSIDLECYGFKYDPKEEYWSRGAIKSSAFLYDIKNYCKKRNIKYKILDNNFERNNSYRRDFFNSHKHFGDYYFCAYCGELHKKDNITVDHIISISAAKKSKILKKILKIFGIENINDIKNLTPACSKCNSKKSSNLKGWVLKGWLGKYEMLWIPRIFIQSSFFCVIFYTVFFYLSYGTFWF